MPIWSKDDIARIIIDTGREMGVTPRGIVIGLSVGLVESNLTVYANAKVAGSLELPHDAVGSDGMSVGVQQQQVRWGNGAWWWGDVQTCQDPHSSTRLFFDRLKNIDYNNPAHSPGYYAQAIQRSAYPNRYDERMGEAQRYYDRLAGEPSEPVANPALTPEPGFSGDPWWLADVLRAEGLNVVELDGWKQRGQGDQGQLWGIVAHHTGGNNTSVNEIAFHRQLGLASHIHLAKDGTVTVCGIGRANHAGVGDYPGLPSDNANPYTIGIEAVNLPPKGQPHRTGWSNTQYDAYVKVCAAICRKLGLGADRVISHKEWAGRKQGKWDPGSIDMNIFRSDIQARIDSFNPSQEDDLTPEQDKMLRTVYEELTKKFPSRSIYRDSDRLVDTFAGFNLNIDGMTHEEWVENAACRGVPEAIDRVLRVAAGKGAVTDESAINRAMHVLESIPEDILEAHLGAERAE